MPYTRILNTDQAARLIYGTPEGQRPTKSQRGHVAELCREGKRDATRAGRRWLIRMEWSGDGGQG